jgi:hypothetical protein
VGVGCAMPLQDLTNQQVESMVQTSGASTTATARHCGRTRNNGQEGTPSPPSGTTARKHSPWTNPRQRKKGRARGTLPHRPTIDERGEKSILSLTLLSVPGNSRHFTQSPSLLFYPFSAPIITSIFSNTFESRSGLKVRANAVSLGYFLAAC